MAKEMQVWKSEAGGIFYTHEEALKADAEFWRERVRRVDDLQVITKSLADRVDALEVLAQTAKETP